MLFRSTGLGKTELVGEIENVEAHGDYLVMIMNTTDPVRWKVRVGINMKDIFQLIKACIKVSIVKFFLNIKRWRSEPKHPGEF